MNTDNALNKKRRIMFVKGNDYYYLAYNILIILYALGCISASKTLKDWRKLLFLINICADHRYVTLLCSGTKVTNSYDKQLLTRLYSSTLTSKAQLLQILFLLESKGIVEIYKDSANLTHDICINMNHINSKFFSRDIFYNEMKNIQTLKASFKMLRTMKYETMVHKFFTENEILIWHI